MKRQSQLCSTAEVGLSVLSQVFFLMLEILCGLPIAFKQVFNHILI